MDYVSLIRTVYLVFSIAMVVLTVIVARKRHRSMIGYGLLAAVFPIPAFLIVLVLGDKKKSEVFDTRGKGLWFGLVIGGTIVFTKWLIKPLDKLSGIAIDRWFPNIPEAPYSVLITLGGIFLAICILLGFLIAMLVADLFMVTVGPYLIRYNDHRRDTAEERKERNKRITRGIFCGLLGTWLLTKVFQKQNIEAYNASHPDDPI